MGLGLGLGLGCCAVLDPHEEARDDGAAEMDEVAHLLVVRLRLRVRVGVRAKGQG